MIKRYNKTSQRRKDRVRSRQTGTTVRHKLMVTRSNKYIYAQVLDQTTGKTLAGLRGKTGEETGKNIAQKIKTLKIGKLVFDRGAYKYHGQVKAVAEAVRKEVPNF
jgi:large subunit ribosomal protein L18